MFQDSIARKIELFACFAAVTATLFVSPYWTIDPINLPKLLMISAFGLGIFSLIIVNFKILFSGKNKSISLAALLMLASMFFTLIISSAPKVQQFFGTNGRNTGFLAYFSLVSIYLGLALFATPRIKKYFLISVAISFGSNAVYGVIQGLGMDPQKWMNQYAPVIGTLGNPNFVSAFLGMGFAFAIAYLLDPQSLKSVKSISIIYLLFASFAIIESNSQQGVIIAGISVLLVFFFYFRNKLQNRILDISYLTLLSILGIFGVLGSLNKGYLAGILYKPSVTYRGDYWSAGIKMFRENYFFGIGLDSYGDWYRYYRTSEATLRRGPSVISNAAHNVFIDIASTAGIVAFLAYLAIIFFTIKATLKIIRNSKSFNAFFVSIFVAWVGYLAQSVISINNLGLSVWGWVLPALLIAISNWDSRPKFELNRKNSQKSKIDFSGMIATCGIVIGATLGFFPFNADANFRSAISGGDAIKVAKSIENFPMVSDRINLAGQLFSENRLEQQMYETAKLGIKFNPRSFDSWNMLLKSNISTPQEKKMALKKMRSLDPHNPDLKKLGL